MRRFLIPLLMLTSPLQAEVPKVVTDIAPVYALVAQVMDGIGAPTLVVPPGASPHHHAMRPSEARALANADLVIWIGSGLTPWLQGPIDNLAADVSVVSLMDLRGVHLLGFREGALFEVGGHDHDHEDEAQPSVFDPHVWLDPDNGIVFLNAISAELTRLDPDNGEKYAQNAETGVAEIRALDIEIDALLAEVRGIPFIVLHDGFHYFEDHFAIEASGAIAASDAQTPGAARVRTLRDAFQYNPPKCAFSEPQVGTKMVETVTQGLTVKVGILDPMGTEHPLDAAMYPSLLRSMGAAIADCLSR